MNDDLRILSAGDRAFVVELGDTIDPAVNARVRALAEAVAQGLGPEVIEVVPTYRSLLVIHDPLRSPRERLAPKVEALARQLAMEAAGELPGRTVHVPACYGGAYGPDLEDVARRAGLAVDEVISIHASATYLVYMLGFTPGFPYLGGMPPEIATPRLDTPRERVDAGFIGIGGGQTGIDPVPSPGGWRLVARTPLRLFDPAALSPFLLAAGDRLRFDPIGPEEFEAIAARVRAGSYQPRIDPPDAPRGPAPAAAPRTGRGKPRAKAPR